MSRDARMGQIPLEVEFSGLNAIRSVFNRIIHMIARIVPMFPAWRSSLHKIRGVNIGKGVFIGSDVFIDNTYPESITIEDDVTLVCRTLIYGHTFAPRHLELVFHSENSTKKGVILKKGCYVGAQCIIMPGVTIGEYSIIGAGSIVTKDIPPYSVATGAPAKVTRTFNKDDIIKP
jgi:acetyltransferase-like isoleucine patch superfamily enzyme